MSAAILPEDFDDAASSGIYEGESVPDEPIQQPRQSPNNRYRYQESTLLVPGVGLINSHVDVDHTSSGEGYNG